MIVVCLACVPSADRSTQALNPSPTPFIRLEIYQFGCSAAHLLREDLRRDTLPWNGVVQLHCGDNPRWEFLIPLRSSGFVSPVVFEGLERNKEYSTWIAFLDRGSSVEPILVELRDGPVLLYRNDPNIGLDYRRMKWDHNQRNE